MFYGHYHFSVYKQNRLSFHRQKNNYMWRPKKWRHFTVHKTDVFARICADSFEVQVSVLVLTQCHEFNMKIFVLQISYQYSMKSYLRKHIITIWYIFGQLHASLQNQNCNTKIRWSVIRRFVPLEHSNIILSLVYVHKQTRYFVGQNSSLLLLLRNPEVLSSRLISKTLMISCKRNWMGV